MQRQVEKVEKGTIAPELLDLMEHEKNIEQGIAALVDMGFSYKAIRDGRKYKAADFNNFDDYCRKRWQISRTQADRIIAASDVARELPPIGGISPRSEGQVRPLTALEPAQRAEAWEEAVDAAGGQQPTAEQVKAAVEKRQPPKKDHPAAFSDAILDQVAAHLTETGQTGTVLDPFAGTGRVHELRDRVGVQTIGVEIEPEWAAKHPDTIEGNALDLAAVVERESVDAIATSPTYGNRMADHHDAKDESVRLTYKHTLGRDLAEDNSGQLQWGDEYREFHQLAWSEAVATLKPGGTLTLNIKNHVRAGEVQRVAEWHLDALYGLGLRLVALDTVATKGLMAGENADKRAPVEFVMTFRKAAS